jgi:DNA-binding response OmpR family regulator
MFKILVVEDDNALNNALCRVLGANGFEPFGVFNGQIATEKLYNENYDLIVSDICLGATRGNKFPCINMPQMDGFDFAKQVRNLNADIPIMFMSARDDLTAKQQGFRIGIDDYMVKPVDFDELILRINALLRRAKIVASKQIMIGDFVMNADEHTTTYKNKEIVLTVREFNILYKLLSYPKKTFTRNQLMDEFWDMDSESGTRTVDVYITKLREKVSLAKEFEIQTVHGLGYKVVLK